MREASCKPYLRRIGFIASRLRLQGTNMCVGSLHVQMLLQSRALEISVEGCIWKPAPPGGDGLLADVLRAFLDPALAPSVPSLMAAKITDLSGLIAHESEATRSAATAALAAVVSALKAPHERLAAVGANSPHRGSKPQAPDDAAASLAAVDRELEQQQMALEHANTVRDRAQAAKRMLALADRRLELITGSDRGGASPSCSPTANAVQAAIRDLNLWTGLVGASSKVSRLAGVEDRCSGSQLQREEMLPPACVHLNCCACADMSQGQFVVPQS